MKAPVKLLLLPIRAPMITLLGLISFYLGIHWGFQQDAIRGYGIDESMVDEAYWIFNLAQVFVITFFCTLPDLVLRQISLFMAASKVVTLVITLFLVIVGGMYLLYLPGFSEMLILASAILLARLDLVRLKVWPPNLLALLGFTAFIIFFITYGEMMHLKLHSWPLIKYLINVIVVGG
jgi:hypothetical protein